MHWMNWGWKKYSFMLFDQVILGAQWLSGSAWLETQRPRVRASQVSLRCGPWARRIYPSLVLVPPRKTRPCLTERLLMGRKESNQTNRMIRWSVRLFIGNNYSKHLGLLITFANSLDSEQAQQNVESDLDPNCLTLWWYSWKKIADDKKAWRITQHAMSSLHSST